MIIPTRNGRARIGLLLESLQELKYPTDRLSTLVVDNGSTDETAAFVRERHPEVRLLREPCPGSYRARMRAAREATQDILAFTDDDCELEPHWLDHLVRPFHQTGVGAVAGRIVSALPRSRLERLADRWQLLDQERFLGAQPHPVAATANLAVRRKVFWASGGFAPELSTGGDFELCYRMQSLLGQRLAYTPDAVVSHRHRNSWSGLFAQSFRNGRALALLRRRLPGFRLPAPTRAWPPRSFEEVAFLGFRALGWGLGFLAECVTRDDR